MNILNEPLTRQEIRQQADEQNYIEKTIRVPLADLLYHNNSSEFARYLSERLIGDDSLTRIDYEIAGHEDSETLYIKVSGQVTDLISDALKRKSERLNLYGVSVSTMNIAARHEHEAKQITARYLYAIADCLVSDTDENDPSALNIEKYGETDKL